MGNEGVHPNVHTRLDLDPGDSLESVCYLVVADDVAQAKLYRELAKVGGLA
jgi:hypothetical protein